jgi:glycosyltransferase involved in cell wall biosynthesis
VRIAVWHNLPSGGGKRALYDHVRGLVERGHHVEAWSPPTIDHDYLPLGGPAKQHIVPLRSTKSRSLGNVLGLTLDAGQRLGAMEEHSRACAEQIAAGSFDILFANSCMFFGSPLIGRHVGIPSVLYLQEPYRWFYEPRPTLIWAAPERLTSIPSPHELAGRVKDLYRARNGRVQVREEIKSAKSFGRVLCNSYFSRESILRAYGVESEVCYLGVDESLFSPGPAERSYFVAAVGAFIPSKNPRLCIRAIGRMAEPRPPLVWVANSVDEDHLKEMQALAVAEGVTLDVRKRIPDEELLRHLQTAFAMIYAPRLEPFGFAPIEAGACETPIVAVAEGGVRETVVDGANGLVVDADPAALAGALERLRDDPELARRLGRNGRQLAETKWSREAGTDRLIAKLEAELARRASPDRAPGAHPAG